MINHFLIVSYWWFLLFSLGLIFFPLSQKLFKKFFDQGYLLSKTIALALLSWPIFLLAHLRLLPFTQAGALFLLILAILVNVFLAKRNPLLKKRLVKVILLEEALFLIALLLGSYIRGLKPDIAGLEKFMDFGFMKSLVNSRFLPPADMWFAGQTINYYYYGHFTAAFLTKLSGLSPFITYNLMIATLFALTTTGVFSLTANLLLKTSKNSKAIIAGALIGALIIGLGSNLHTPYHLLKDGGQNYWYPNATRYIGYDPPTSDKTIHEFPAYSFIVADLHGHVSGLPLVILFIGTAWSLFQRKKISWLKTIFLGFFLGLIYMTNAWDLPIYLLFLGLVLLIKQLANQKNWQGKKTLLAILSIILPLLIIIGLFLLTSLPFNLNFNSMFGGIDLVISQTPIFQLVVLWGAFGFWVISFFIFLRIFPNKKPGDLFVLGLILTAVILIALPEIIYIKDIYGADFYRANTMFKFTFQAYLILTIASGYIIVRVGQRLTKIGRFAFLIVCFFLVLGILVYPAFSVSGFYGSVHPKNFQGLSGLDFWAQRYPEDYQAIIFVDQSLPKEAIVLEAAGDSYTDYGRVSAFTGRPTIQGWLVHEWLWRNGYDLPAKRANQVQTVYQDTDLNLAREVLDQYSVDYIFFGKLEKEKYPNANPERLSLLGRPIFKAGETVVFEVGK
ncbi:MAG: DUF2298 domain-containing protein [Candidatus Shapirobacteria bacterium]|nr:DUF2298 domain-containing protein [Candidatus Shapirobacteria bacterium]